MTRVLIVDDHPIFRQGLRQIVESAAGLRVVGEAADVPGARAQLERHRPDVAVLDLNLPGGGGLELVQCCRACTPAVAALVLTMHREEATLEAALARGAAGYVLKDNAAEDVLLGIRAVAAGGLYLSPSLAGFLGGRRAPPAPPAAPVGLAALTPTERRVLRLIAANRTSKEIAHELCIGVRTVETHRAHIGDKLGLHGAQAVLRYALEQRALL